MGELSFPILAPNILLSTTAKTVDLNFHKLDVNVEMVNVEMYSEYGFLWFGLNMFYTPMIIGFQKRINQLYILTVNL